ncbi:efflux RND transporter permease subunit, partial [Arthrospira platensis SPKY1]|nr:efflux RND transporter permease subunit [Arthrospira platensis SPKY1]
VKLKPKSQWTTTNDKEELANLIKAELEKKIPNTEIEFTQPIEMRFNELISGTRSDVGIKIFGDDLNTLARIAEDISKKIKNTPGASDVVVEKTEGLPQIKIVYDRFKLAQYNLNVYEVNQTITAAFAGSTASTVLEGEKRFDLVVRMDKAFKNNLQDVQNLW